LEWTRGRPSPESATALAANAGAGRSRCMRKDDVPMLYGTVPQERLAISLDPRPGTPRMGTVKPPDGRENLMHPGGRELDNDLRGATA